MNPRRRQHHRRTTALAGALYLLTFITSIPALLLKQPLLDEPARATTADGAFTLAAACVLELVLAAACVGTAVALFPVVRRVSVVAAMAFVTARTVEATLILIGVAALRALTVDGAATMAVALHDELFLLGPGLVPAVNALCLAPVLLRGRLVPRVIPAVGLIGAPLLLVSALLVLTGVIDQVGALAGGLALPIAVWEFSLGVWLLVRGVRGVRGLRGTRDGRGVPSAPGAPRALGAPGALGALGALGAPGAPGAPGLRGVSAAENGRTAAERDPHGPGPERVESSA